MSPKLHQGAPPLPPPKSKEHLYTASVRRLGWVTLSGSPECGHTWQTVSGQAALRKGKQDVGGGGGGGGALGYGQALSKRCFNMHSQQESVEAEHQQPPDLWSARWR